LNRTPGTARRLLAVVNGDQTDEFKFFLARGSDHLDFVTNLAVEESLAIGDVVEMRPFSAFGFLAAHERVFDLFIALQIRTVRREP